MAPSVDCIAASLYCAEEDVSSGCAWDHDDDDEEGMSKRTVELHRRLTDSMEAPVVLLDFPVEDDEAISMLMHKEARSMPEADYLGTFLSHHLHVEARQNAIRWMLKVQEYHNFGPLTVALSVNYMDRFLSRHHLPQSKPWMFQLLSVACISLAAKMEETEVPILLDLQVQDDVEQIFEAHTIQRMELLVLSTLEWRMSTVTPFSYIDYYFHKLGISNTLLRALLSRVSEIILATARDIRFLIYLPSVVAAAATISSLEEVTALQAADLHQAFVDLSIDVDALKKCYQDMQEELLVDSHCQWQQQQQSKRKGFQCSSQQPLSPVGVLEAAAAAALSRNGSESSTMGSSRESSPGQKEMKKKQKNRDIQMGL
ncbi:unnamed protein product [Sphagnum jensenii]|uniref:Cyclin N-terminal domain-containing protein n=1 Tax=Sphagnum jensenii TaxID=128206 RepID=A0ABP0VKP1_9BRYO